MTLGHALAGLPPLGRLSACPWGARPKAGELRQISRQRLEPAHGRVPTQRKSLILRHRFAIIRVMGMALEVATIQVIITCKARCSKDKMQKNRR
jgi:hypothetical protein